MGKARHLAFGIWRFAGGRLGGIFAWPYSPLLFFEKLVQELSSSRAKNASRMNGKLAPDTRLQSFHSLQLLSRQTTLRSTA
jgi:hypothetical protein